MTQTTKAFILAPLVAIGFAACSAPKQEEQNFDQKRESCRKMIDADGFKIASTAKYIDGREGVYKLTRLSVYQETKAGDSVAYFAGRATIPQDADPSPTPVQDEKQAETEKPNLKQIETKNEVVCYNTDSLTENELSADIEAPLSISPKDGKVAKELPYKITAQFKRQSEKASTTENSSAKSTTEESSSELSPLEGCTLAGSNCEIFGVDKKAFILRVKETTETSSKVLLAIYRISPLPKREAPKTEQPK